MPTRFLRITGIAHTFVSTAVAKSTYFQLVLKIDQSEGNFLPHT
jgi:hypothetical protein